MNQFLKILKITGIAVAIFYSTVIVGMFFLQRNLVFKPEPLVEPSDVARISLANSDGTSTNVWTNSLQSVTAVVYLGGNAGMVVEQLANFARVITTTSVYLVDYPGYGLSTGEPSEKALFTQALAVFDKLAVDHTEIYVIGRSLGSGVAAHLAAHRPVNKLILLTPYDSLATIAAERYPWLPTDLLLQDRFHSIGLVDKLALPILVVEAVDDTVISNDSTDRLLTSMRANRQIALQHYESNRIDHYNLMDDIEVLTLIGRFFDVR